MTPTPCFGLHVDDQAVFLHEAGGGRCLTPGLHDLASPFSVEGGRLTCPHRLPEPASGEIPDHPLVEALSPIGRGGFHVPGHHRGLVESMLAMVGPTRSLMFASWATDVRSLYPELTLTNAAPLVVFNYEPRHFVQLERLIGLPRTRALILCGPYRLKGLETLDPEGLDRDRNWAATGAAILWRFVNDQLL